jgi:AraC-like DNA-binding protein
MNTLPPTADSADLVTRLLHGELFERYRAAFHLTTSCSLRLVRHELHQHSDAANYPFITELCVPVSLGGRIFAHLCAEPIRLSDKGAAKFEDAARQMLDDGCTPADLRAARHWFDKLPVMSTDRARAVETMLQLFATQLGEFAEKLFLQTHDAEPDSVRRARHFISTHLHEPMTLEEVSRHAGVSPFHFCKVFKRATGMTFTEFVNRARVEQAKRLLLKPQARVTEVAFDVGFQSLSQFNRSFRRVTAISPTQYRARLRQPVMAA